MTRLFVALDLPPECRQELADLALELRGVRWLDAERIHLTLAFLGEISEHLRPDLLEALSEVSSPALQLAFEGVGFFPRRGAPTTFWVGCREDERLKRRIDRALTGIGVSIERRRFRPHVTVARLKNCRPADLQALLQTHSLFSRPVVDVSSFSLYSSKLEPDGAVYRVEQRFALEG
jgi:2'-5' RNA ligase